MKNKKNPKSACFTVLLRRLLCSGDPQTHPSDQIPERNQLDFDLEPKTEFFNTDTSAAPGIVARLMGLDSLPERNSVPEDPARVSRSKSVNFIDYLLKFDLTQAKHQQLRTSVSFREVPPLFQEKQGHELLLVYLENDVGKQSAAELLKQRKCEREKVLKKDEKKNKISNLKDEPRWRRRVSTGKMEKRKEISRFGRRKRKEIIVGKAESHQHSTDELRQKKLNSKKKCSQKPKNSYSFSRQNSDSGKSVGNETDIFMELVGNLCKLTEEEIKGANWTTKLVDFKLEEICEEFGGQILELLLDQVVDEFLWIS